MRRRSPRHRDYATPSSDALATRGRSLRGSAVNRTLTSPAARLRGLALAIIAALALLITTPFFGATAALAHDDLVEATPADGSELAEAPTEAVLRFSGNVLEIGTELALVRDDSGEIVPLTEQFTADASGRVTQPLPALETGAYTLNWRVVSEDGHPISGSLHFGVGTPAGDGSAPAAAEGNTLAPTGPNDSDPLATIVNSPIGIALGIGAFAAAIAGGLLVWQRMRKGGPFGQFGGTASDGGSSDGGAGDGGAGDGGSGD